MAQIASVTNVSLPWLVYGEGHAENHTINEAEPVYVLSEGEKKEWERQAIRFKEASKLAFQMSRSDPDSNPGPVWSALVMELVTLYGLDDRGAQRLIETVQLLRDREQARNGPD